MQLLGFLTNTSLLCALLCMFSVFLFEFFLYFRLIVHEVSGGKFDINTNSDSTRLYPRSTVCNPPLSLYFCRVPSLTSRVEAWTVAEDAGAIQRKAAGWVTSCLHDGLPSFMFLTAQKDPTAHRHSYVHSCSFLQQNSVDLKAPNYKYKTCVHCGIHCFSSSIFLCRNFHNADGLSSLAA